MRRYLHHDEYTADAAWRLLDWLVLHGDTEFTMAFMVMGKEPAPASDRIDAALRPYELRRQQRERVASYGDQGFHGPTALWSINAQTIAVLRECFPDGPLGNPTYAKDGWFENLEFYRDGQLVFGAVSHEGEAMLHLGEAEWPELTAAGFPTRDYAAWI